MNTTTLTKGELYSLDSLKFTGWTEGDGSGHEGYNCWDYFDGRIYRGPDAHGIEPLFVAAVSAGEQAR